MSLDPPTTPSQPSQITMDMYLKLQKDYDALKKENVKVVTDNVALTVRNEDLSKNLKKAKQEKNYYFNRSNHYHRISIAQRNGEIPRKAQDAITRKRLQNKLSEAQLDILLKNQKTSKKFSKAQCSRAMEIAGRIANTSFLKMG